MQTAKLHPLRFASTLPIALIEAKLRAGAYTIALEDPERAPLTYDRLIIGAMVLGRKLAIGLQPKERIGLLLPNVNGTVVTLFGLMFHGFVPVILNFTAGLRNLKSACETAEIRTLITSRRFIEQGKLDDLIVALGEGRRIVYLEDIRKSVTGVDKLRGLIAGRFAHTVARRSGVSPDDPAVVLFTSGSEGAPKGVVLSHRNLLANVRQIETFGGQILDDAMRTVFNPLPIFHSFGLTAGLLLGLLTGHKVVMYPSPLHFKQVPKLIKATQATLIVGTDTFLMGYARAADADDLGSVVLMVAGAEKVKEETRKAYDVFGATILEGYGATECSPVLACNHPEINRPGSVGRLLPLVEHRLEPVEGISEGGRLLVRGPNVMLGYMLADRPGVIQPHADGWHDTGDIVALDELGRVIIKGRAKRFAKLGGEMISLAAVETLISDLWPGFTHVCVTLPDPRKGEMIVLVTDKQNADKAEIAPHFKTAGVPELWAPRALLVVPNVPVMGSGKVDYPGTAEMVKARRGLF
jgi:acyl-[acyl-carrier-protein]-phospholipid O-acyltransferase / long-chain-fatty-acid--[acyl-carrier-protein] ligase